MRTDPICSIDSIDLTTPTPHSIHIHIQPHGAPATVCDAAARGAAGGGGRRFGAAAHAVAAGAGDGRGREWRRCVVYTYTYIYTYTQSHSLNRTHNQTHSEEDTLESAGSAILKWLTNLNYGNVFAASLFPYLAFLRNIWPKDYPIPKVRAPCVSLDRWSDLPS